MSAYAAGKPVKILRAWEGLGAEPEDIRSWSAWSKDRSVLYVTLPQPDILPDGQTIPLWNSEWKKRTEKGGIRRANPRAREQWNHLREAFVYKRPMMGFLVTMRSAEKIDVTYPDRLLRLTIVEPSDWNYVVTGRADGVIVPEGLRL